MVAVPRWPSVCLCPNPSLPSVLGCSRQPWDMCGQRREQCLWGAECWLPGLVVTVTRGPLPLWLALSPRSGEGGTCVPAGYALPSSGWEPRPLAWEVGTEAAALPRMAGAQIGYPQVTLSCPSRRKGRLGVWGPWSSSTEGSYSAEISGLGSSRSACTHPAWAYLGRQHGQRAW